VVAPVVVAAPARRAFSPAGAEQAASHSVLMSDQLAEAQECSHTVASRMGGVGAMQRPARTVQACTQRVSQQLNSLRKSCSP
jgi:hypothetical protein